MSTDFNPFSKTFLQSKDGVEYNIEKDLVLTYDFELKHFISTMGGESFFVDHLVNETTMQKNNFLIYKFFKDWHFDKDKNDIFIYKDIPFGFSLRMAHI